MCGCEEVCEHLPARGRVELSVGLDAGDAVGGHAEEAAGVVAFLGVCALVWK